MRVGRRRLFLVLWGLGLLGTAAALPFGLSLLPASTLGRYSVGLLAISAFANVALMTGLLTYFGLRAGKSLGLGAPIIERWVAGEQVKEQVRRILALSLLAGGLIAVATAVLEHVVFAPRLPQLAAIPDPAAWKSALASLYGGITEELITRLGMFSIVAWILTRFGVQRTDSCWAANVIMAVVFGVLHLPVTAGLLPLTPLVVSRALVLNGVGGLVFGHLYWTRGLEAAMLAHFATDIVMDVLKMFTTA